VPVLHISEKDDDVAVPQLHQAIVSSMNPQARLTVLLDCCCCGSTLELLYV
jgi:hypothetical protein